MTKKTRILVLVLVLGSAVLLLASSCGESNPAPNTDRGRADIAQQLDTAPPQLDGVKLEGPRTDGLKPDGSGVDGSKIDGAKTDAKKTDGAKTDAKKADISIPSGCGNGVRAGTEECDDGNNVNLDGCDATCHFEQSHRVNYLVMQFGIDTTCTKNAFGGAISTLAQGQIQSGIDTGIADGSISILFKYLQLDDLTGTTDPAVTLGVMAGTPAAGTGYSGTSDLDWWYTVAPATYDAQRNPLAQIGGKIASGILTAGPGTVAISINFGGTPMPLTMSSTKVSVTVGATSKPLLSTGSAPGHLAAEHLDPALVSFASTGTKTPAGAGSLCGNVGAAALKAVPFPAQLAGYCSEGYTAANSMLDVLVGGCSFLVVSVITPTQPDSEDPGVAAAGAGPPYTFVAGAGKAVTTCQDKNKATVPLQACLSDAAYSLYLKFASGRVILK